MSKKIHIFLMGVTALLLFTQATFASEEDWIPMGKGDNDITYMKADTYKLVGLPAESRMATAVLKYVSKKESRILRATVMVEDCAEKYGSILFTDVNFNSPVRDDFAFGGENRASVIAESLCTLVKRVSWVEFNRFKNPTNPSDSVYLSINMDSLQSRDDINTIGAEIAFFFQEKDQRESSKIYLRSWDCIKKDGVGSILVDIGNGAKPTKLDFGEQSLFRSAVKAICTAHGLQPG